MSRPRTRAKKEASEIFQTLTGPELPPAAAPSPQDPAEIAAACLLEDLAAQHALSFGKPELNIIEVPGPHWLGLVMHAIRPTLYARPRAITTRTRKAGSDQPMAVEVYRGADFHGKRQDSARTAIVATELLSSTAAWIVTEPSENPRDGLPVTVLASADRVFSLPEFTEETYARFLERATGTPPRTVWQPAPLTELTPDILRMSARAKQSADDYARRLVKVIEGQRAAAVGQDQTTSSEPEIGLDQLHGMPAVVEWGRALARDLRDYKAGLIGWGDVDRGALLVGPPGVGKTRAARSVAAHCSVPLLASSYSDWQGGGAGSGTLGDVVGAIMELFKRGRDKAPCIIFLDELDAVNSRGSTEIRHKDWWRAIISALLVELDGATQRDGVVVLAATNSPSTIDPALLRAGRLDRLIHVGLPDAEALSAIYRHYLGDALSSADFARLGAVSLGRTGADVEMIARGARRRARRGLREVHFEDVFAELAGELPPSGDRSRWPTAIHESGHAAVMEALQPGRLRLVSLCGHGNAAGGTIGAPSSILDMTAITVDQELSIMLGGRAGEELILGSCTGGSGGPANSDLAMASWTAFTAEVCFGLGDTSLLWSPVPAVEELHKRFAAQPDAAKAANLRIRTAYERAKTLVATRRRLIGAIAEALLDKYVLTADELAPLLIAHANDADDASNALPEAEAATRRLN